MWILSDDDSNPEQGRYVRLEMRGEESHAVLSAPLPRATIECQCIDEREAGKAGRTLDAETLRAVREGLYGG